MACTARSTGLPTGCAPRKPDKTALYKLVAEQRATFTDVTQVAGGVPSFVTEAFTRVLSLPHPLRYRLAYDQALCTAVHRALLRALRARLRRLARAHGQRDAETGSRSRRSC